MSQESIIKEGKFSYSEYGSDNNDVILLLHGLMGALSNFEGIIDGFKATHKIVIPQLPIFDIPIMKLSVKGLMDYIDDFVNFKKLNQVNVCGNSLGGHLAQLYTIKNPDNVQSMILTGSSGLFESAMGNSFPKRGSYKYIQDKARDVFYNPDVATKELIDAVYEDVNNRDRAIRIIKTAKSAIRHNLGEDLHEIKNPSLLIWGANDTVTPPFVGEKFHELLPNSQLFFIEECGHAPMMEKPTEFNNILRKFLEEL